MDSTIDWRAIGAGVLVLAAVIAGTAVMWQPSADSGGQEIAISLAVDDGDTDEQALTVTNNTTAFEALNASHMVEYETSSYGYFITGIDGTTQNNTHSWMFFVNGEPPSVGANSYTLSDGDNVTFRLMDNDAAMELVE